MNTSRLLSPRATLVVTIAGLAMIVLVGLLDYATGPELSLSVFYLLPISLLTWFTNKRIGILSAAFCTIAWLAADLATQAHYVHSLVPFWNALVRFLVFLAIVYLESALKTLNRNLEAKVQERTASLTAEVAQRKKVEEDLQTLSQRLIDIQEAERHKIARELHDEVGQALTGIGLTLDMAAHSQTGSAAERLAQARSAVVELMDRVSSLSLELRPALLDDLGLLPALLWYTNRYSSQTGIDVVLRHSGVEGQRFNPEVETAVYRIIQEALTNVARHAKVNEASVALWCDQQRLTIQVEDHGVGFDYEAARQAGCASGLLGMQERAWLLKGNLTIESAPHQGTRLLVELPAVCQNVEEEG